MPRISQATRRYLANAKAQKRDDLMAQEQMVTGARYDLVTGDYRVWVGGSPQGWARTRAEAEARARYRYEHRAA